MLALGLVIRDLDFEADVELEPRAILRLVGNADGAIVKQFAELIVDLHARLTEERTRGVVIDIRKLEFMNASCFNVFVNWLTVITELPVEQRYHLDFESNPAIPWQQRSLKTLACFATDLVSVRN